MTEQTLLHELAHAFLFESGKVTESQDEDLVEWISVNAPKLMKTFEKVMEKLS